MTNSAGTPAMTRSSRGRPAACFSPSVRRPKTRGRPISSILNRTRVHRARRRAHRHQLAPAELDVRQQHRDLLPTRQRLRTRRARLARGDYELHGSQCRGCADQWNQLNGDPRYPGGNLRRDRRTISLTGNFERSAAADHERRHLCDFARSGARSGGWTRGRDVSSRFSSVPSNLGRTGGSR